MAPPVVEISWPFREHAGTGDHAGFDGGFGDDVETGLGGCCAETHGVAAVEVHFRRVGGMEDVFFDGEIGQAV